MRGVEAEHLFDFPYALPEPESPARFSLHVAFGPVTSVAVFGNRFCLGFPSSYEIECRNRSGAPLLEIQREDWPRQPVTQDDRETFIEGRVETANPRFSGELRSELTRFQSFAEHYPAFHRLVPSETGDVWVGPYDPSVEWATVRWPSPRGPTTWSVFSSEGAWLSDVTLPARFHLMWVGSDYVVGTIRDDLDIESVVVLSLRR